MSRNVFNGNWITTRDIPDLISYAQRVNRSVMILGGAGLGKSAIVKQTADAIFGARDDNLVDLRLTDKEPTDVAGQQIPIILDNGDAKTIYARPDFWPSDPEWEGIIFLDEMLHADTYMQKVAFQIVLDRRIGNYKLPRKAILVAAGNRLGDGSAVTMMEAPLANRFIIVECQYSAEYWIEDFALPNDIHPSLIGMLKAEPTLIENFEKMEEIGSPSYSTPRSLENASLALYDYDAGNIKSSLAKAIIQGCVGEVVMNKVWLYHTKLSKMTPIADIMSGTETEHTGPRTADMVWMVGSEGNSWLRRAMANPDVTDDEILEAAGKYITYMHNNFKDEQADFVNSILMSFIRKNSLGNAILQGSGRERLPSRLMLGEPIVKEIIVQYQADFGEAVNSVASKK